MRFAYIFSFLSFIACSSTPRPNGGGETPIGPDGGSLSLSDGSQVVIPAGAVQDTVAIEARSVTEISGEAWTALPPGIDAVAAAIVLTPHGTTFSTPVKVRLPVNVAGDEVVLLRLANETANAWEPAGPVAVINGFAEFSVSRFSIYAVAAVAAGACPCWNGGDLSRMGTEHAARTGVSFISYEEVDVPFKTTVVSFPFSEGADMLVVQETAAPAGECRRQPTRAQPLFTGIREKTTAAQTQVCRLLVAAKFKGDTDSAQVAGIASGLPNGGSVTLNITVTPPNSSAQPVAVSTVLSENGVLTWAGVPFPAGATYTLSVGASPRGYMCVLKNSAGTGTFALRSVIAEVQCISSTTATDIDGDGTPNDSDGCPSDPLKIAAGDCGCGVSDIDADADATPDCRDACNNDPAKVAPGICGCGLADIDSDSDGTFNCADACTTDPNKTTAGQCGCGIADVDLDGDGTADCNEQCPNDPIKIAPGQCGCGVADTDGDSDGSASCVDLCDADAAKTAPGQCGCGFAETDTDTDGTANCNDGCPADGAKISAGQCGCGVADTDTDEDGTPNCTDACPNDSNKTAPGACGCGVSDVDSAPANGRADCLDVQTLIAPKDYDPSYDPSGAAGPKTIIGLAGLSSGSAVTWFDQTGALQAARIDSSLNLVVGSTGITGNTGWVTANPSGGRIAPAPAYPGDVTIKALPDGSNRVLVANNALRFPDFQPLQFSLFRATSPIFVSYSGVEVADKAWMFAASGYELAGRPTENNFGFFYGYPSGFSAVVPTVKLFKGFDLSNSLNIAVHAFDQFDNASLLRMTSVGAGVAVAWSSYATATSDYSIYTSVGSLSGLDSAGAPTPVNQFAASFTTPVAVDTSAASYHDVAIAQLRAGINTQAIVAYVHRDGSVGATGAYKVVTGAGAVTGPEVEFGYGVQQVQVTSIPGNIGAALVFLGAPTGGGPSQLYAMRIGADGQITKGPTPIATATEGTTEAGHHPSGEGRRFDQFVCTALPGTPGDFLIGTSKSPAVGNEPIAPQRVSKHR